MSTLVFLRPLILCILLLATTALRVGHAWKGYSPQCDRECSQVG